MCTVNITIIVIITEQGHLPDPSLAEGLRVGSRTLTKSPLPVSKQ
jgi:hypothetical protein